MVVGSIADFHVLSLECRTKRFLLEPIQALCVALPVDEGQVCAEARTTDQAAVARAHSKYCVSRALLAARDQLAVSRGAIG